MVGSRAQEHKAAAERDLNDSQHQRQQAATATMADHQAGQHEPARPPGPPRPKGALYNQHFMQETPGDFARERQGEDLEAVPEVPILTTAPPLTKGAGHWRQPCRRVRAIGATLAEGCGPLAPTSGPAPAGGHSKYCNSPGPPRPESTTPPPTKASLA